MAAIDRVPTTYQLVIELAAPARLVVGRLGTFDFPAGRYVYTGSAKRGVEARLRRHLSRCKRQHWHIDYLLAVACIVETRSSTRGECELNQHTSGRIVVRGFGASDCRAGCDSHLKWLGPPGG